MAMATVVGAVATAVATGIAVGLASRWLSVPGNARRANQLRTEAEILSHLPDGAAKDALSDKVQRDVLSHLDLEADRGYRRLRAVLHVLLGLDAVLAFAMAVSFFAVARKPHGPEWAGFVIPISLLLLVVNQIAEFWIGRKLGVIRAFAEEKAEEEVQAGGSAQLNLSAGLSSAPTAGGTARLNLSADMRDSASDE